MVMTTERVLCAESYTSVGKRYGLHRQTVSRIVRGLRRATELR
jgi:hypothetical protein